MITVVSGFQVANSEVEKESENIADEFLEGDASESNVDAFLEKFMVIFFIYGLNLWGLCLTNL